MISRDALHRAQLMRESGGNPNAISPVGARGLMQIMPDTAASPGFGLQPLQNIDDPQANEQFGFAYMDKMLERYKGDVPRALAAYNWGPGNADKWDGNINTLPDETRTYITEILSAAGSGEQPQQSNKKKITVQELIGGGQSTPKQQKKVTVEELIGGSSATRSPQQPQATQANQARIEGAFEDADRVNRIEVGRQDPISAKFLQGVAFNFGDEIIGGIQAPFRALADGTSITQAYREGRDEFRAAAKFADQNNPGLALGAEIIGALATGTGLAKGGLLASTRLAPGAGLLPRIGAGAKDAAIAGAAFGAGAGENLAERATGAVSGAGTGAVIGGGVPVVGRAIRSTAKPLIDAAKARINPQGFATQKVAERLANDATSLPQVQKRLGDGLNIADVAGQGSRDLLRTTTNIAGEARNRVSTSLTLRQIGQGDRLKSAIARTFADPDGYLNAKEELAESAKTIAKPFYDKAYANPVPFTEKLEGFLNTASGKKALREAVGIASDEQAPFAQWFANIADDGTTTIKRVPDMRAWDYIKRGFDRVIEGQTDSITGKVTTSGRAVIGLKNRMLAELDNLNPDYAKARKAYAGVAQIDEALEFGKSAIKLSPEAVSRKMKNMSASEKEAARIGMAEVLRKQIDDAGFTHNAINRIVGSRSKFQRLRAMFESKAQFKAFRSSIMKEAKKQKTFDAVRGNSTTARQLMDLEDAGQLGEVGGVATNVAQGNIGGVVASIGRMISRVGGLTPEVADNIARQLSATNPRVVSGFMRELAEIEKSNIGSEQRAKLFQDLLSRSITSQVTPALAGR